MSFSNLYRTGALVVMLLGSVIAAQAATATTTANVNVRSGAGTHYKVITTLSAGTQVSTDSCHSGWCALTTHGHKGFVAKSLLQMAMTQQQSQSMQHQPVATTTMMQHKPMSTNNAMMQHKPAAANSTVMQTPTPRQSNTATSH